MRNRGAFLFSILFCLSILVVPAVQTIFELRRGERIQAADIAADVVITPLQRTRNTLTALGAIVDSLTAFRAGSGSRFNAGEAGEQAEELMAAAEAVRNRLVVINRHVTDSTGRAVTDADSLIAIMGHLRDAVVTGDSTAVAVTVNHAITQAGRVTRVCKGGSGKITGAVRSVLRSLFKETLFSKRYLRAYEKELEDRSVVIQAIRPVMQVVRYVLLGDVGVKAVAGRQGWLFYRPGIEYLYRPSIYDHRSKSVDYNDSAVTDDPVAVITDFRDQLAEREIDLLVMIVPGKGSIYPDMLAAQITPSMLPLISPTREILSRLRREGIAVVDLFGPLLTERKNDSLAGERCYLARDTHWRSRGLRCAAKTVAQEVRKRPWYRQDHVGCVYSLDTVEVERIGDVGVMTGLSDRALRGFKHPFKPEVTKCFPVLHNYLDGSGAVVKRKPFRDDFKNGRILVIGDSFSRIYQTDAPRSAGWVAHLAYELSEPLAAIISDGGASTLVREKLARKSRILKGKRLVIWEFVERDLRYGAFGWKKVELP